MSFYPRTTPLKSSHIIAKLFGEFGNSGEFKASLNKNEVNIANTFAKDVLIYFSQKLFDFGKIYKIEIELIEPRKAKHDFDSLVRSFVRVSYNKQIYDFFYIKNKSIEKSERNDNMPKITFYEEVKDWYILLEYTGWSKANWKLVFDVNFALGQYITYIIFIKKN